MIIIWRSRRTGLRSNCMPGIQEFSQNKNWRRSFRQQLYSGGAIPYYIETINETLGTRAKGRKIIENDGHFQLQEKMKPCQTNFDGKNGNIDIKNAFKWDINP